MELWKYKNCSPESAKKIVTRISCIITLFCHFSCNESFKIFFTNIVMWWSSVIWILWNKRYLYFTDFRYTGNTMQVQHKWTLYKLTLDVWKHVTETLKFVKEKCLKDKNYLAFYSRFYFYVRTTTTKASTSKLPGELEKNDVRPQKAFHS